MASTAEQHSRLRYEVVSLRRLLLPWIARLLVREDGLMLLLQGNEHITPRTQRELSRSQAVVLQDKRPPSIETFWVPIYQAVYQTVDWFHNTISEDDDDATALELEVVKVLAYMLSEWPFPVNGIFTRPNPMLPDNELARVRQMAPTEVWAHVRHRIHLNPDYMLEVLDHAARTLMLRSYEDEAFRPVKYVPSGAGPQTTIAHVEEVKRLENAVRVMIRKTPAGPSK
ncbi:hypothetical protein CYLTODRAFT_415199 [Cylindrobasidium torrendii FP15055 ss-10]|uniref:Uncharacterized protein n=1 Tax=Cylindrobasidium torrendii FP15055 ss-10 TaxID=1314674 RepID=A0A0D7AUW9_9AGAR|nr:hypothetical protein CYLTODRAFT_415199 [Cylindrobasidium torrendii FP15055 ss-10]